MSENTSLTEAVSQAEKCFNEEYNCAQSVLEGLRVYFGISDEDLWKLATGLGAGMGRRQLVCGALTAGAMACGIVIAQQRKSSREDRIALREATYAKVRELTGRFEERFGTVECRAMTNCDLLTPEGQKAFKETNQRKLTCHPAVRFVIENVVGLCA